MRLVFLTLLLVAGAACERDAAEPSPAAVFDPARPCEVASATEVAEAVGGRAGEARTVEARSKDRTMLCSYAVGAPVGRVTLHVEDDVSEEQFVDRMARDQLNTEELKGPGELAFVHGGVSVSVWEDGRAISASLQQLDDIDEARGALERLANVIAARL